MLANKRSIAAFVKKWTDPSRGHEDADTQTFWEDLLEDVLDIKRPRDVLRFEHPVFGTDPRTKKGIARNIDVYYPDKGIVIEQKSRGVDLDAANASSSHVGPETPYQQAFWYRNNLPADANVRWIVVCNFDEIRIHDLNRTRPEADYETVLVADLEREANRLSFISDDTNSRIERERRVSIAAGEKVVELYHRLAERYLNLEDDREEQHSLNVLIVRLVFLLFAEDAELFPKDALYHYLYPLPPGQMRMALVELFEWLDTPPEERDPYEDGPITAFPYVDGGLFDRSTRIKIPSFDLTTRLTLVEEASRGFDWSEVSPTIFGAVFESTLNPETRREGGMHYTSIENIHKVIDPLFLDALKDELDEILVSPEGPRGRKDGLTRRQRRLHGFQDKLASIKVLDPACGSGNFLTEGYLELRRLENRVIAELYEDQTAMEFEGETAKIKVSIDQFFGIEVNDFAVSVARTALWIAEQQMMEETSGILRFADFEYFPLSKSENIVCANALTNDWADVLPANECDYVIGNPPFVGARMMAKEQKAELMSAYEHSRDCGNVDFVAAWFARAVDYMSRGHARTSFVATNSISQGEQVAPIWSFLKEREATIDFCHDTFRWDNEASEKAHVFCCIIGFSLGGFGDRVIYHHESPDVKATPVLARHINGYLRNAPDLFVWDRQDPISDVPKMRVGNKPVDNGIYLFNEDQMAEFLRREPAARPLFHPYMGAKEFMQGKRRWILWLGDLTEDELLDLPLCRERIEAVREWRLSKSSKDTKKLGLRPAHYHVETIPKGPSVLVPLHTSERRAYIPMGFIGPEVFASNATGVLIGASTYHFGVMQSFPHNAWMRLVAGRIKGDYRYSIGLVYNNFVWPEPTETQRQAIEHAVEHVLEVRGQFPNRSLEKLYDPKSMPESLRLAHTSLDEAVLRAYNLEPTATEDQVVAHLISLYRNATR